MTFTRAKKSIATAAVLAAVVSMSASVAHSDAAGEVRFAESQYRHDVMEIAKYSLTNLMQIREGKTELSGHLALHAQNLANSAAMAKAAFEKDTRGMEGHTETKDAVWENWEDYATRMDAYEADTAAFAAAAAGANGDMRSVMPAFGKAVSHCKSCHDKYRD